MKVKVEFTLRAVQRKGMVPRYDLSVILKDIKANQKILERIMPILKYSHQNLWKWEITSLFVMKEV